MKMQPVQMTESMNTPADIAIRKKRTTIKATGHKFSAWAVTQEATVDEEEVRHVPAVHAASRKQNYPGQTAANNEIESVQYCAEDQTEDEVSESNRACKGRFHFHLEY